MTKSLFPYRNESPSGIRSVQEYAVSTVHAAIRRGEIPPGARISPYDLAAELGVSHTPVREALRELEGEGHIIRIPRRGFFVPELSLEDVQDIYRCRRLLETEAQAFAVPRLTDRDIAVLESFNEEMERAVSRRDYLSFAEANVPFHFTIFERSESEHLLRFVRYLWGAAERYYLVHLRTGEEMRALQEGHRQLLTAFRLRDARTANRVMDEHRMVTLNAIRTRLGDSASVAPDNASLRSGSA